MSQVIGQADEIAEEAVLFLIQASYITGQSINVNGGLYVTCNFI